MKYFTAVACLAIVLVSASGTFATDLPELAHGLEKVFHGGNAEFAKSGRDTVFLIGPYSAGAPVNGQFEDAGGNPAWNGWTHWDPTEPTDTHWHVSDYMAAGLNDTPGNLAAYCGDATIEACVPEDPIGGYGNSYNDIIEFNYVVADPAAGCTMSVSGVFNSNTEPAYDYITFQFITVDGAVVQSANDGIHIAENFIYTLAYGPADYVGHESDTVRFQILVTTDGGWSDEDCIFWGDGACQVDDLRVQCSNGDYDGLTDFQDGNLEPWTIIYPSGVGDFANLWTSLEDIDPCASNYTPQVAFIDDGNVVSGVGPSYCQEWCYGPGGYIVNTTGGAVVDGYLTNYVESPVMDWPSGDYLGAELRYDAYLHEDLSADAPGIFFTWKVRSTADEINSPIAEAPWRNRGFVYYGGPAYIREGGIVTDLLEPGRTHVQVRFEVLEWGYYWGWTGNDGYPAPYLDNVRFTAFQSYGPGMSSSVVDLAQDNFTEINEEVDMTNLAINNVRFDRSKSKAGFNEEHNIPGDSIICDIASVRVGGLLVSNRLVYTMQRNPVFDSVRDPDWGISGSTDGTPTGLPDQFCYDLPDSGFLFPGDVLHYYFEATDEVGHADPQTSTLPEDISGFGNFAQHTAYEPYFQVHALPSVSADGSHPEVLYWQDSWSEGDDEWFSALNNLGLELGVHFDTYFTNGPSNGHGSGLGGRAVYEQIKGYTDLLYSSGFMSVYTICNGDFNHDPGRDVHLLTDWFAFGEGRDAFFCGDDLATDMAQSGALTSGFLNDFMNIQLVSSNLRPFIGGQATPVVLPEPGNSVFYTTESWIAFGGCLYINPFDAVNIGEGAERLARFTNPNGTADYSYSAMTLNVRGNDRIITMPYDFRFLYTDPDNPVGDGLATRVNVLREILAFFQVDGSSWAPTDVPASDKFFARNHPNPFNPMTKIEFNLPQAGQMTLKIYNVRGELVKTLMDEAREAGAGHIMWDGSNAQGARVSSGIYFCEARTGDEVQISKMALVK